MLLADMLVEIGYTVAAEAASIDEALEATRKSTEYESDFVAEGSGSRPSE
jgi:hypothetical protein